MSDECLVVEDLSVEFPTPDGVVHAVNGVSLNVAHGETLGIVGESGSGKSVSVLAALGLIRPPGRVTGGRILFQGTELRTASRRALRSIRGRDLGLVSQDPMTSFNPVVPIGAQIDEAIRVHDRKCSRAQARRRSIELLERVGVHNPARRYQEYPHEFSGGMRQRAMIAMAIANGPKLLIADEPTTALDVTIQAQVLEVLASAVEQTRSAMILITHDLGVIAEMADRVVVMYSGRVVEHGDVHSIFHEPHHPYTVGLMSSLPRLDQEDERLTPIRGNPPSLLRIPAGCPFAPRCELAAGRKPGEQERCATERPALQQAGPGHGAACHFHADVLRWRDSGVVKGAAHG